MKQMIFLLAILISSGTIAEDNASYKVSMIDVSTKTAINAYAEIAGKKVDIVQGVRGRVTVTTDTELSSEKYLKLIEDKLNEANIGLFPITTNRLVATWIDLSKVVKPAPRSGSYADRLAKRREVLRKRNAANMTEHTEELQAKIKAYQKDLKRSGGPLLPIQLSKEMDAQLVKEGILPPQKNSE